MKILIVHNLLWSHYKARVFSELNQLLQEQAQLKVVHLAETHSSRKTLGEVDLSIHKYDYEILLQGSIDQTSVLQRTIKLAKFFLKYKPDLIIMGGYSYPSYWFTIILAFILRKKIIITANSTEYDHERKWWREKFKSFILSFADQVFCYGNLHKNYMMKLGVKESNIRIVCQATHNDSIKATFQEHLKHSVKNDALQKEKSFLFVGRFLEMKNLFFLLDAFKAADPGWELKLVGAGELEKPLREYVFANKIEKVKFLGALPWNEVAKVYSEANVLILPSVSETWGLVVNEAMICQLPVLVSNRCGCANDLVKENLNGFIFSPYDQKELTVLLNRFIRGELDMEKMGKASGEIIKEYTPESAAAQMYNGINAVSPISILNFFFLYVVQFV